MVNLQLLYGILTNVGYNVRPATTGKLGLEAVAAKHHDLILLDICMPELNGFEVCRRLKSKEDTKDITVIFIIALVDAFDTAKFFRIG